jgi:hypothetical protein
MRFARKERRSPFMSKVIDADFIAQRAAFPTIMDHVAPAWRTFLTMGGDIAGNAGFHLPDSAYALPEAPSGTDPLAEARALLGERGVRSLARLRRSAPSGIPIWPPRSVRPPTVGPPRHGLTPTTACVARS